MNHQELIRGLWDQMDDLQSMLEDLAIADDDQWLAAVDQMMGYSDED
jgi:hypothetical protein